MIVRKAQAADTPAIVAMGAKFYASTEYPKLTSYCPGSAGVLIDMMREDGVLLVAARDDGSLAGMAGLMVAPFLFNHSAKTAHEVMWWVDPTDQGHGAGKALLGAIEPACREAGCVAVQMIHLSTSPPQAAALYERMGYVHSESSYTKAL